MCLYYILIIYIYIYVCAFNIDAGGSCMANASTSAIRMLRDCCAENNKTMEKNIARAPPPDTKTKSLRKHPKALQNLSNIDFPTQSDSREVGRPFGSQTAPW